MYNELFINSLKQGGRQRCFRISISKMIRSSSSVKLKRQRYLIFIVCLIIRFFFVVNTATTFYYFKFNTVRPVKISLHSGSFIKIIDVIDLLMDLIGSTLS